MAHRSRLTTALRRLGGAGLALWLVASVAFFVVRLAPGDPARSFDPAVPQSQAETLRKLYGLDRPLTAQYAAWLSGLLRGDLGWSFDHRRPVAQVIATALPPTLGLAVLALGLQYGFALTMATWVARRRIRLRRSIDAVALLLYTLPTFWLGLLALRWLGHGHGRGLFPTHGAASPDTLDGLAHYVDVLHHAALPALVLALANVGLVYRLSESALRLALAAPYAVAARARGLSESRILWWHALRNASAAPVTRLGLDLPLLLSGSLVIEVLFSRPGLGRVAHQAYLARDLPVLAVSATAAGALVVLGSLLADALHGLLDPRVARG
jgi:peptide/nickel transport system permease protein